MALVGMALAAKYPDRLLSLTICSSPTVLPQAALNLFSFGYSSWQDALRNLGSRGWAESLSKVPGTVPTENKDFVNWWLDEISLSTAHGLIGYSLFLEKLDARSFMPQITIPSLILAPAKSAATPLSEQEHMAKTIPNAKIKIIHGQGHEIYVDKADECISVLLEFLTQL